MKIVMKFGGSSLADGSRILRCGSIIERYKQNHSLIVVVSAMDDVTDKLLVLTELAKNGNREAIREHLEVLRAIHIEATNIIKSDNLRAAAQEEVSKLLTELEKVMTASTLLKEVTPRTRDLILSYGERLSSILLEHTLKDLRVDCLRLQGGEAGILTDEAFGEATPLFEASKSRIRSKLNPLLEQNIIPVVTGFIGETQNREITTLGRGGSDLTATLIAAAVKADEVWLWTDVDGIMTADPKLIPNAKTVPQISYAEAREMTALGAKAIHPRAIEPIAEEGIPVRVKNTFAEENAGTLITSTTQLKEGEVVKALALVKDVGLITVSGAGMVGKLGTAAKIFDILSKSGVNILMISQSISESNISVVVNRSKLHKAVTALELALLGKGVVSEVHAEDDVSVVAAIGAGMQGTPGVAARIFGAVAKRGVNIRMIAQGSSELSISFVVKEKDALTALKAIHDDLNLGG
ncbi:MAG: aspartate kinase [Nitrososphaerales archaeon]